MKSKTSCREAIDESLSGVRFNARDMRAVLSAVREQEAPQEESGSEAAPQIAQDAPARRRRRQPGLQIIRSQQAK